MPNRIIKESILTSPTLSTLTAEEERHFYRVLLRADDWGCFESTPAVIRGACYPHFDVTVAKVGEWSDGLERAGIIRRWKDGPREFAVFSEFDKHNSKYSVTADGKPTRHRRKTPPPPVFASLCQPVTNDRPNPNPNPNPIS